MLTKRVQELENIVGITTELEFNSMINDTFAIENSIIELQISAMNLDIKLLE